MSGAAKKIINGLVAAKVSAADQKRSKALIDDAYDWDANQAAVVEAIVRYVCGVGERSENVPSGVLESSGAYLLQGLSTGRDLDGWDRRALDILAQAKAMYWFWKLDRWLRDRVEAFPAEPIFDEALELFRARGLWPDDTAVIVSMVGHLNAHVTSDKALTSTGRWLLERLDRDTDGVLAIARAQKDGGLSLLYALLLAHRRELFEKLMPELALPEDSDRSFLAEKLLEADPQRYESKVMELLATVTHSYQAVLSANNLVKHLPGKHLAEVKRLLRIAIKGKSTPLMFENMPSNTRALALDLAWRALGEEAAELWSLYKEVHDTPRLDFYETIAKQSKDKALPFLIEGLVYPRDPKLAYAPSDHAKYVQRMIELLEPYDLTPYRERIEAAFKGNKSKKIREQIDPLLGKAPKPSATAREKKVVPFLATDGYQFDVYAAAIVTAAVAAAKKEKKRLPSPIEKVKLGGMPGDIQLNVLILEGVGETAELELRAPRTRLPTHVDETDDDRVLRKFARLHRLGDGDDVPMWGDMYKLPWCVLLHEQVLAARAIADALKSDGFVVADDYSAGAGEDDNFFTSPEDLESMAREEINALPAAQQADFAAVCFVDSEKQRWLRAQ